CARRHEDRVAAFRSIDRGLNGARIARAVARFRPVVGDIESAAAGRMNKNHRKCRDEELRDRRTNKSLAHCLLLDVSQRLSRSRAELPTPAAAKHNKLRSVRKDFLGKVGDKFSGGRGSDANSQLFENRAEFRQWSLPHPLWTDEKPAQNLRADL